MLYRKFNRYRKEWVFTVFIIFSLSITFQATSQITSYDEARNLMKYWKLRGRLTGERDPKDRNTKHDPYRTNVHSGFLIVGNEPGMSIPAQARMPEALFYSEIYNNNYGGLTGKGNCGNLDPNWRFAVDSADGQQKKGLMHWGDSPIELGHYLIALAFEWSLLNRWGESTYETEKELYYALKTIQRIDYAAEDKYGEPKSINGFFFRDDVPFDFALNNFSNDYDLVESAWSCTNDDGNSSGCDGWPGNPDPIIKGVESYDQLIGILLGLAVVNKIVPHNVSFNNQNLQSLNAHLTDFLIDYVKKERMWILRDPQKDNQTVCRGAFSGIAFSYPIAVIGKKITGNSYQDGFTSQIGLPIWRLVKDYYSGVGGTLKILKLKVSGTPYHPAATNDNINMFLQCAVGSRTAGRVKPATLVFDPDGKKLVSKVSNAYYKEFYDLLNSIMTGYKPKTDDIWWRGNFNMLDCGCNCIYDRPNPNYKDCVHSSNTPSGGNLSGNPWTTHNRWEWFKRDVSNGVYDHYKEFSGLDYMEAFNAYRYKFFAGGGYQQRLRYPVNWALPIYSSCGQSYIGWLGNPLRLKAVFEIETNAKLLAGPNNPSGRYASLYLSAGTRVVMGPGFETQPGTFFDARTTDYDCIPYPMPCSKFMAKGTEDTTYNIFREIDTTVSIYEDVYEGITDTFDYIDTTYITIDTVGDTIFVELRPCYEITDDNEIVNICDSSGHKSGRVLSWHRVNSTFNHLSLYPNPARDAAYIEYHLYDPHTVSVSLFNTMGQDISYAIDKYDKDQSPGNYKIRINTMGLPPGVYYCRIKLSDQETVKKLNVY